MIAVTDAALARLNASIQNSSSMKSSLAENAVPCTRNTSRPRTFSRTRTKRLPSEKRRVSEAPTGHPRYSAIDRPSLWLADPANNTKSSATRRLYGEAGSMTAEISYEWRGDLTDIEMVDLV